MSTHAQDHLPNRAGRLSDRTLRTYRALGVLAAVIVLGMGLLHRMIEPDLVDPPVARLGIIALILALVALSYRFREYRYRYCVYAAFYATTFWIVYLLAANAFAPRFGLALIVVIAAVSPAFHSRRHLLWYGIITICAVVGASLAVADPWIPRALYSGNVIAVCALSYVILGLRLRTEAELAASQQQYALAALGANDGLWDLDLRTGKISYTRRWKAMLGLGDEEIGNDPEEWMRRIHPDDVERVRVEVETHRTAGDTHFRSEYRIRHRDGDYRWMVLRGAAIRDDAGMAVRMAGSQTDVTERKAVEDRLVHDALHDALTGLPNRTLFMERLDRLLARSRWTEEYGFAVLFMDLDRFKIINDSLGHSVGDALLTAASHRLMRCVRVEDTVARLGGDEFAVLLTDIKGVSGAIQAAERLQRAVATPFELEGQEIFTSTSIGIALSATGYEHAEDALRDADAAMYRAKAAGRARYSVFDREMHEESIALLRLEGELRRGIQRGEFHAHYQPIVALDSGSLIGFEALVRWRHPDRGLLPPADFIPLAEETGLIVPLGAGVIREACRQMRAWQEASPRTPALTISVNLSARQFSQPNLVEQIDEVLHDTGLDPRTLKLEITESAVMKDAESAIVSLDRLRERGIQIAIDDFGTGYSSLSYLQQFPVDTLKIDRSFVSALGSSGYASELVRTVLALASSLGIAAIAEGVETAEQRSDLGRLGCGYAQGYLFSKPLDASSAENMLKAPPWVQLVSAAGSA